MPEGYIKYKVCGPAARASDAHCFLIVRLRHSVYLYFCIVVVNVMTVINTFLFDGTAVRKFVYDIFQCNLSVLHTLMSHFNLSALKEVNLQP